MRNPLLSLTPSELRSISTAIRSGRAAGPFTSLNTRRFVRDEDAEPVAASLTLLSASGISSEGLALSLELLAEALSSSYRLEDLVDLVTTGPEAGGTANRSTAVVVSDLFRSAQRSVLIAGYAVYQGQKVFQALAERMTENTDLQVRLFLDVPRKQGDASLIQEDIARYVHQFKTSQWPIGARLPNIYCCAQSIKGEDGRPGILHAKCISVDDETVFVSSANFTEAAQTRNIEVGLLVKSTIVSERLCRFFESLLDRHYFARSS